jgi:hypothetical protein
LTVYETMELPLTPVLYDVECAGVRIDPAPLVELEAELRRELERLTTEIYELAGEPFNINSPQQVADIFEKLNYETSKKTATGRISTSADVLEELAERYDLPRLILEYREHEKLLNTYVTVSAASGASGHGAAPHDLYPDGDGHGAVVVGTSEPAEHSDSDGNGTAYAPGVCGGGRLSADFGGLFAD